jgi:hypothetical protein
MKSIVSLNHVIAFWQLCRCLIAGQIRQWLNETYNGQYK